MNERMHKGNIETLLIPRIPDRKPLCALLFEFPRDRFGIEVREHGPGALEGDLVTCERDRAFPFRIRGCRVRWVSCRTSARLAKENPQLTILHSRLFIHVHLSVPAVFPLTALHHFPLHLAFPLEDLHCGRARRCRHGTWDTADPAADDAGGRGEGTVPWCGDVARDVEFSTESDAFAFESVGRGWRGL